MKVNTNNSTMDLWKNFMEAKTEDEKKKVLQENMKSIQTSFVAANNKEDETNIGELADSELSPKEFFLKEMLKKLKLQALAEKLARGQHLTDKEMKNLKKNAPELLAKARIANRQRKMLESKIKNVKTKKEADDVLFFARGVNISISGSSSANGDKELGLVLNEAVKQAQKNTQSEVAQKQTKEQEKKRNKHIDKLV